MGREKRVAGAARGAGLSNAELARLWSDFLASPPQMTEHGVCEASEMLFDIGARRTVRAALFMLTQTGRELVDLVRGEGGRELFREVAECAEDRADRLRGAAEALDNAACRLRLALCDDRAATSAAAEPGAER